MDEMDTDLEQCLKDWTDLSNEYADLEEMHAKYRTKLDELHSLQKKCLSGVTHQRYRLKAITKQMGLAQSTTPEEKAELDDLNKDILRRKAQLSQMEDVLPRASGTYLKIILGSVNVSILDKKTKYDYKDQYEQFKLIVTLIGCVLACFCLYFNYRVLDLLFMFLTVWYYCTLTIRESILKVNGSRIRGWWRAHHFISTVVGGVLLVWPDGTCYQSFRNQLMWFNVYLAFIQYLQFTYQRGCLYRLRSLGERNDMDITIDGFHSWMWKGLSFLLPFLYFGYMWQLYNSYTLYYLSYMPDATWQVPCLSFLFFVLGGGNVVTTSWTIPSKIRERNMGMLKLRFTRLDKYFWSHTKRRSNSISKSKRVIEGVERIMRRSNSRMNSTSSSTIPEEVDQILKEDEKKDA